MPFQDQPSETEALIALLPLLFGGLAIMLGFVLVHSRGRERANPGDALLSFGLVSCIAAAFLLKRTDWSVWLACGVATVRLLFAMGNAIEERHHPTRSRGSILRERARNSRQRIRDRRIVEETIRRYDAELAVQDAARGRHGGSAPIDITPPRRREADVGAPALLMAPGSWDMFEHDVLDIVDAEFEDVEIQDTAQRPSPDEGEILVRFATPIDEDDLFSRPDRARTAMDAILTQLGEGARIVGIRARVD